MISLRVGSETTLQSLRKEWKGHESLTTDWELVTEMEGYMQLQLLYSPGE
jgi:hypothetical protein